MGGGRGCVRGHGDRRQCRVSDSEWGFMDPSYGPGDATSLLHERRNRCASICAACQLLVDDGVCYYSYYDRAPKKVLPVHTYLYHSRQRYFIYTRALSSGTSTTKYKLDTSKRNQSHTPWGNSIMFHSPRPAHSAIPAPRFWEANVIKCLILGLPCSVKVAIIPFAACP